MGIDAKNVSVACVAFGSVIAESCTLFNQSLADFRSPQSVELQGDPLVFASPNGFDCRVALYLRTNLRPKAPPSSIGTWLAIASFSRLPLCLFVEVLSGADGRRIPKVSYGLPKSCMSYVQVGDGVLAADALEDESKYSWISPSFDLLQENPDERSPPMFSSTSSPKHSLRSSRAANNFPTMVNSALSRTCIRLDAP